MRFLIVLLLLITLVACEAPDNELTEDEIAANNRGVALMGQFRNEDARQVFAELVAQRPEWTDVEVNLAIATLNRQRENDELVALEIVERILVDHPDHLRALYIAGLMRFYIGDTELSLAHLGRVVASAPEDAHASYFYAQALSQLSRIDEALEAYKRSIELDPYLRSAYYGAALAYRQLGDSDRAREMLRVYQRFESNPRAQLAEFVYTRKGVLANALAVSPESTRFEGGAPDGELFGEPIVSVSLASGQQASGAAALTVADIDDDGRLDLLLNADQTLVLRQAATDQFVPLPDHPLSGISEVASALWGDLANRGAPDVMLCRRGPNQLYRRDSDGQWTRVDEAIDLADEGDCADGAVIDADHDGDLDLLVVNRDRANELYNNDFNGRWRALSETPEASLIAGGNRDSRTVQVVDLEGDRDGDLIILHHAPPHQVLINDRLWRYAPGEGFARFVNAELLAVTVADLDASGQMTLVGLDPDGVLWRWTPDAAGQWVAEDIGRTTVSPSASAALSALDFSGDGKKELLIQHDAGFQIMAWDGAALSERFSATVDLLALTPILLDPAQGPSLAGWVRGDEETSLMIWPAGQGRGRFVSIAPTGLSDDGAGMRSNASGVGTHLVLRSGTQWAIVDTYDRHGAAGQSLQPLSIGVGSRDRADFVKLLWSDGVLQTEMDLVAGEIHRITEHQRQLASCPVLYAWNGESHEFVSDLLGVGGLGFFVAPGEYAPPRPWEYFRFPEGSLAPRDGRYEIKIGEPMEEIAYIDTVRLHVHDVPPGWGLVVDERMHTGGGPEPTGEPVFYQESLRRWPFSAVNHRGEEVLETILTVDGRAAPPGDQDPRFLGRLAEEHELTLIFSEVINPLDSRPVLVANGWVDYPYSQTLFAAWQAGVEYRPPSLDAFADGQWSVVYEQWGYPAGMPREMSLPLNDLPAGTTALRLRGNWEVYWDSLSLIYAESSPAAVATRILDADLGRLARTGFPRRDTLKQSRPFYDYQDRAPFWDTRYPTGFYTDFGPVDPLITTANGAMVVFGPGEELHLEFVAPPAPQAGWRREVVLEVRGFAKDMDLYTGDGGTVGPLPVDASVLDAAQREALHESSLNRFQGGF